MQLAISSTSPDMTTLSNARPDDKFIDLKCNLKKKKELRRKKQF